MLEQICEMQINDQFLDNELFISALKHVMKLILCSCILLVFMNIIFKQYYALAILQHIMKSVNS